MCKSENNNKTIYCEYCNKSVNKYYYKKHCDSKKHVVNMEAKTTGVMPVKEYKCTECDFVTKYKHVLTKHIKAKHSNATESEKLYAYGCTVCGTKFSDITKAKKHMKTEKHKIQCAEKHGSVTIIRGDKYYTHPGVTLYITSLRSGTSAHFGMKNDNDFVCKLKYYDTVSKYGTDIIECICKARARITNKEQYTEFMGQTFVKYDNDESIKIILTEEKGFKKSTNIKKSKKIIKQKKNKSVNKKYNIDFDSSVDADIDEDKYNEIMANMFNLFEDILAMNKACVAAIKKSDAIKNKIKKMDNAMKQIYTDKEVSEQIVTDVAEEETVTDITEEQTIVNKEVSESMSDLILLDDTEQQSESSSDIPEISESVENSAKLCTDNIDIEKQLNDSMKAAGIDMNEIKEYLDIKIDEISVESITEISEENDKSESESEYVVNETIEKTEDYDDYKDVVHNPLLSKISGMKRAIKKLKNEQKILKNEITKYEDNLAVETDKKEINFIEFEIEDRNTEINDINNEIESFKKQLQKLREELKNKN